MSTSTTTNKLPVEPDAHALSRQFRTGVRILLATSLIATCVGLFLVPEAAYLAAIPIPFLYAILAVANYMEVRSRASELRLQKSERIGQIEMDIDVETAGVILLLKVLGILAASTFIIAAAIYEWQVVGIVAAALFLLAVLINIPYLPLFLAEAERDEMERLRSEENKH
ncbi:hypothetical protein [Rhodopirellula bahusiensis]|uniref:hypothetical protein n=1 Tax=Rhodopirellula bahusiensis TaxID=2014065 RepID=UPI001E31C95B|nr:hypothetical protein [Rhodopirellula bahusiensis]